MRTLSTRMQELVETYEVKEKGPQTGKTIVVIKTRIRNPPLHRQYSDQRATITIESRTSLGCVTQSGDGYVAITLRVMSRTFNRAIIF